MDAPAQVRPYQRRQARKPQPDPEAAARYAAKLAALQRRYAEDAEFRRRRMEYARNRAAALAAARRAGGPGGPGGQGGPGAQ